MATVPSNLIPTRVSQLQDAPVASADGYLLYTYNGNTYKVRAGDLLQVAGVPTTRNVFAGTGMTGGGQLSADITLSVAAGGIGASQLNSTGVTAGLYGAAASVPQIQVDANGRVTSAVNIPISGPGLGSVSSIDVSGGTTGLSFSGGPITTYGTITMSGTLAVANGGTGATTAAAALTSLGAYPATNPSGYTANTGTVTSVSVVSANGFGGTVATATSTPAVTLTTSLTGLLKGNGTAMSVATAGTDYAVPGANGDITSLTGITGGVSTPDYIQFDTVATLTPTIGRLGWDSAEHGLSVLLAGGNVNLQIGQETVVRVYNNTGSPMSDGQIVYVTGSSGQRMTVALAQANSDTTSATILGMVTEPIANNAEGFITVQGTVHSLNTTGYTDGQVIYLSPTTPGAWTNTKPVAPQHMVIVGYVIKGGSGGAGSVYIHTQNGYELDELHDVKITTVADGNLLQYYSAGPYWRNVAPSTVTAGLATALAGGVASQIPYQTGAGVTSFIANGTAGQVLVSAGASVPTWGGINGGTF